MYHVVVASGWGARPERPAGEPVVSRPPQVPGEGIGGGVMEGGVGGARGGEEEAGWILNTY